MLKSRLVWRIPLLLLAVAALLAGMWAGLLRIGWQWPLLRATLPVSHGPLMICGFLGTLIILERAVVINRLWAYLGVLWSGLGGLLLLVGVGGAAGPAPVALGSQWLVIIFFKFLSQHPALHTWVMAAGALSWLVGCLLWLGGQPVFQVVLWWMGFLVFTIAGERLELNRVMRPARSTQRLFVIAAAVLALGVTLSVFYADLGTRVSGVGLLALAAWLLRYDLARRTVYKTGLTRFIAVCLLGGYFWLAFAGAVALGYGFIPAGPVYDALLHAVFLGFVISMIFGHAPVIFPAVLNIPMNYRPVFYAPLALLHASLLLRMVGDFAALRWARLGGGLLNAIAILAYFGLMAAQYVVRKREG